jgi:hypothetical protein
MFEIKHNSLFVFHTEIMVLTNLKELVGARKRKRGTISKPEEPASRPLSVREFHRAHESKVLPHVRRGTLK